MAPQIWNSSGIRFGELGGHSSFVMKFIFLIVQRAKFSASVMVSAGVCYGSKECLYFLPEQAQINADDYTDILLPNGSKTTMMLCLLGVILQQDSAPAHTSRLVRDWLGQHRPDFIKKDEGPPNSPDHLNKLNFHVWGAMLESRRLTR